MRDVASPLRGNRDRFSIERHFGSAEQGGARGRRGLARGLGLGQYAPAFADNGVDAEVLPRLTAEDLREMGVVAVGHRRKLLEAIAALQPEAPPPALSAGELPRGRPPPARGAERRQLTVMFVDLVGSTALSAGSTPRTCAR